MVDLRPCHIVKTVITRPLILTFIIMDIQNQDSRFETIMIMTIMANVSTIHMLKTRLFYILKLSTRLP